jgi:hypothetical protein
MNTTQQQRLANPARFVRKDARTQALRLVYGPAANRHAPTFETVEDWNRAMQTLHQLSRRSEWPPSKIAELISDMQRLNPSNSKKALAA